MKETIKEKLLKKILDKDTWEQNDKTNIKIYVRVEVGEALDEIYNQGFENAEKVFNK